MRDVVVLAMKVCRLWFYYGLFVITAIIYPLFGETVKQVRVTATSFNCARYKCESCNSQIIVDEEEVSPGVDGLNIVVLDSRNGRVIQAKGIMNTLSKEFKIFVNNIKDGDLVIASSQVMCNHRTITRMRTKTYVIQGLKKLGAKFKGVTPESFRSGIYIFCKTSCPSSLSSKLPLPLLKLQKSESDPVLLSFSVDLLKYALKSPDKIKDSPVPNDRSKPSQEKDGSLVTALVVVLILIILMAMAVMIVLYLRLHKRTRKLTLQQNHPPPQRKELNQNATNYCECKRASRKSLSTKRKTSCMLPSERYNRVTLPRRHHSDACTPSSKGLSSSSFKLFEKYETPIDSEKKFASYISVYDNDSNPDERETLYKIPSNIRRHAPPKYLPPSTPPMSDIPENGGDSYVEMNIHEYEDPSVGFIASGGTFPTDHEPPWQHNVKKLSSTDSFALRSSDEERLFNINDQLTSSDDTDYEKYYVLANSSDSKTDNKSTGKFKNNDIPHFQPNKNVARSVTNSDGYTYSLYEYRNDNYTMPDCEG